MPIYEFKCNKCGYEFEELIFKSSSLPMRVIINMINQYDTKCPQCGGTISKKLSSFSFKIK
jgi:putative FmdB family regulatory protein